MRILVTGGFGNVGRSLLEELISRDIDVVVFQRPSKKNKKIAKKYGTAINMAWGDVSNVDAITKAVADCDVIIHLAAMVPPATEKNQQATFKVNVEGTLNFIKALEQSVKPIPFIFGSSMSVMGPTQSQTPPISHYRDPNPTTNYTNSKIEIEKYLKTSGIKYLICRIGAVVTTNGQYNKGMLDEAFNFPLNNRIETILDKDCATALSNAAEMMHATEELNGKILPLGGGKSKGHHIYGKDFTQEMFKLMGIGALDERAYSTKEYFMDWSDTTEAQTLLNFQNHTYEEALTLLGRPYQKIKPVMKLFSKGIRKGIERMSPHYPKS